MGLFEDVVVNAKTAANVVGKKASQIVDISKLRISAAELNHEIESKFEDIGRRVYEAKKLGNDADVSESISALDDLYEQLDAVNDQLAATRTKIVCKNCGEQNTQGSVYCSKCGHKLSEEE